MRQQIPNYYREKPAVTSIVDVIQNCREHPIAAVAFFALVLAAVIVAIIKLTKPGLI